MAYTIATFENCAPGFERLRRQSESILTAYPGEGMTPGAILAEFKSDLDSVMREDGFDYDAARLALDAWYSDGGESAIQAELDSIDWLEFTEAEESWPIFLAYLETEEESGQ